MVIPDGHSGSDYYGIGNVVLTAASALWLYRTSDGHSGSDYYGIGNVVLTALQAASVV